MSREKKKPSRWTNTERKKNPRVGFRSTWPPLHRKFRQIFFICLTKTCKKFIKFWTCDFQLKNSKLEIAILAPNFSERCNSLSSWSWVSHYIHQNEGFWVLKNLKPSNCSWGHLWSIRAQKEIGSPFARKSIISGPMTVFTVRRHKVPQMLQFDTYDDIFSS